jgi:hypothetical protein
MKTMCRFSLVLTFLAALLAPSLATASVNHVVRCPSGYHKKITRKHHRRHAACVRNRGTGQHPVAKPPTAPITPPTAATTPPTTPTTPPTTPTTPPTATTPSPPPFPTTTPPPPPPPPFASARDANTETFKADDAQANYDIAVQGQFCGDGFVSRAFPSVGNPAGTYVWTVNQLWARPENSNAWHMDVSGDYFYNGTHAPVFDWYDYKTGQVGGDALGTMNAWTINPGWYVTMIQYVWVNGAWYSSVSAQGCAF